MTAGQQDVGGSRTRGARMPRRERRAQLLESALEVFGAQGYHAAAMDDIAEGEGDLTRRLPVQSRDEFGALAEALAAADDDPVLSRTRVATVLESLPGVGPARARRVMDELDIADSRRLRGLGPHQRAALIERFT